MTETESGDEISRLVGDVAVEGARAEFALRMLLVALLESPYGDIFTAARGAKAMIDDCQAVLDVHHTLAGTDARRRARELLDELDSLRVHRNMLVHGILARDQSGEHQDEPEPITALYGTPRRPAQSQQFTVEQVRQTANRLKEVSDELLLWTFSNLNVPQQILPAERP